MTGRTGMNNRTFFIRLAATTAAIALILGLVKIWYVDPSRAPGDARTEAAPREGPGVPLISWRDAPDHVGERVTVEGTIVRTHNSGRACFLNFHPDYRRHFTAVIFASAFGRFPPNPEEHYRGKRVRVTGPMIEYGGAPEIVLEGPEQIEVVE